LRRGRERAGNRPLGEEEQQMIDDDWRRVWAEMTDEELEARLSTYHWLAMTTPNSHAGRLRQLADEAERRGQAAMVERAKLRAQAAIAGDTEKPQ
jgi:hypothetical protein